MANKDLLKNKIMGDAELDNVAGGSVARDAAMSPQNKKLKGYASMEQNANIQTLPQMNQEDMPLHKIINGTTDSQQPADKILIDGQKLNPSESQKYGRIW